MLRVTSLLGSVRALGASHGFVGVRVISFPDTVWLRVDSGALRVCSAKSTDLSRGPTGFGCFGWVQEGFGLSLSWLPSGFGCVGSASAGFDEERQPILGSARLRAVRVDSDGFGCFGWIRTGRGASGGLG